MPTNHSLSAVVLAAGQGTRLRPLTDRLPKPLLPLATTTLLGHNLEHLSDAGIRRILTVIPPGTSQDFERYATKYPYLTLDFMEQQTALGTGHAVALARDWIGENPFFVCYGDNVTDYDFASLVHAHRRDENACTLALREVADPTQHGVVELEGRRICRIVEKPANPPSNLSFAGMCILPPNIFEAIDRTKPSADGEYYLPDAIQLLIDQNERVGYDLLQAWRLNVNRPQQLMEAHEHLLRNAASDQPGTAPVSVAPDAVIGSGATISPDVTVSAGCTVGGGSRLSRCILLPNSTVGEDCVLSNVIVDSSARVPSGTVCEPTAEPAILAHTSGR